MKAEKSIKSMKDEPFCISSRLVVVGSKKRRKVFLVSGLNSTQASINNRLAMGGDKPDETLIRYLLEFH